MNEFRLVRGFSTLDAAAAAVNALVNAGIEHGATTLRAGGGVYLVIVEAATAQEQALAEQVLGHAGRSPAARDAAGAVR